MLIKNKTLIKVLLPIFNFAVLTLYLVNYSILNYSKITYLFFWFLVILDIFCLVSALCVGSSFYGKLLNVQCAVTSCIILLLFLELITLIFPGIWPLAVRNYLALKSQDEHVERVEYLKESPYVKFKPYTLISSQGFRGSHAQFTYDWYTDRFGFKNDDSIAKTHKADIVVLGDSFSEGMGVEIPYIWSSILTSRGYTAYNLGVQGYAPVQMEGVLQKYGLSFKPRWVIIAYFASTYTREGMFFDVAGAIRDKKFITGTGMRQAVQADNRREIRKQAKLFTSAIICLVSNEIYRYYYDFKRNGFSFSLRSHKKIKREFSPFRAEISDVDKLSFKEEKSRLNKEWENTLLAFRRIIRLAEGINAKVILMYLPARGTMYYEKAFNTQLPQHYYEKDESEQLKTFALKEGIIFLNPSKRIRSYMLSLPDNVMIRKYPYFEIDGHPNRIGHKLIADEVLNFLKPERKR